MDNPKFCKDCKHFNSGTRDCYEKRNKQIDLVRGVEGLKFDPSYLRSDSDKCGPDGAWFVAKEAA